MALSKHLLNYPVVNSSRAAFGSTRWPTGTGCMRRPRDSASSCGFTTIWYLGRLFLQIGIIASDPQILGDLISLFCWSQCAASDWCCMAILALVRTAGRQWRDIWRRYPELTRALVSAVFSPLFWCFFDITTSSAELMALSAFWAMLSPMIMVHCSRALTQRPRWSHSRSALDVAASWRVPRTTPDMSGAVSRSLLTI